MHINTHIHILILILLIYKLIHLYQADGALAQMLALRRQSRKKGLLDAQRNELLIRNRYEKRIEKKRRGESPPSSLRLSLCLLMINHMHTTRPPFVIIISFDVSLLQLYHILSHLILRNRRP